MPGTAVKNAKPAIGSSIVLIAKNGGKDWARGHRGSVQFASTPWWILLQRALHNHRTNFAVSVCIIGRTLPHQRDVRCAELYYRLRPTLSMLPAAGLNS
jgi:hypothetical protein